jgi:hypothetical protein
LNVFIGVPTYRYYVHYGLVIALLDWVRRLDYVRQVLFFPGLLPIDLARNQIVKSFLQTDATHLLMLDDDVIPPRNALEKLLADGKDIVSGIYPAHTKDSDGQPQPPAPVAIRDGEPVHGEELEQVDYIGGGCLLVRRQVFEAIDEPWFEFEFTPDHSLMTVSEDVHFCNLAKAQGFGVWADFNVQCGHVKMVDLREVNTLVNTNKSSTSLPRRF